MTGLAFAESDGPRKHPRLTTHYRLKVNAWVGLILLLNSPLDDSWSESKASPTANHITGIRIAGSTVELTFDLDNPSARLHAQQSTNLGTQGWFTIPDASFEFVSGSRGIARMTKPESPRAFFRIQQEVDDPAVDLELAIQLLELTAEITPGDSASAILSLGNVGTTVAVGASDIRLYASLDATLSADDLPLGGLEDLPIVVPPRRATAFDVTIRFPRDLPPGKYYVLAELSDFVGFSDANPGNNTAAYPVAYAVQLKVRLDDYRRYDAPRASWVYDAFVTGLPGGTASVRVEPVRVGDPSHVRVSNSQLGWTSTVEWQFLDDRSEMLAASWETEIGVLDLQLDHFSVVPSRFNPESDAKTTVTSSAAGVFAMYGDGVAAQSGRFQGTAESEFTQLGFESVVLQSGKAYAGALKYQWVLRIYGTAGVTMEDELIRVPVSLDESTTQWAMKDLGVIRSRESRKLTYFGRAFASERLMELRSANP